MSRYSVIIKEEAQADLKALSKNEPRALAAKLRALKRNLRALKMTVQGS